MDSSNGCFIIEQQSRIISTIPKVFTELFLLFVENQ